MKVCFIFLIMLVSLWANKRVPVGGFSSPESYKTNIPNIIDTSLRIYPIEKTSDSDDPDYELLYRDPKNGRIRLYRDDIGVFADGERYYVADGTHRFGAPRFRPLTRCNQFSYYQRLATMAKGMEGHFDEGNVATTWMIMDHSNHSVYALTDKNLKQYLLRFDPLLYNDYASSKDKRKSPIEYLRQICDN